MKRFNILLTALAALLAVTPAVAQNHGNTLYVSQSTGSNRNAGTKDAPLKNIQKAVELAQPGDVICVAEGNYYGLLNSGVIRIDKGLSILGGYATDFSERDILEHRTYVQPTATSNGTAEGQGTIHICVMAPETLVELDGLIIDRGNSIAYNPRGEAWPDGVDSPMMQPIGTAGVGAPDVTENQVYTSETALVYIQTGSKCDVTIRNCAFINGPNFGIMGSTNKTRIIIDNCVFVNIRMAAVELRGSNAAINSETHFTNNTILFTWTRLKDLGDMGYGYRFLPKMNSYLDHNIIGCCAFAGLDRTHVDSPASKEAERVTTCENTLFFHNRQADLILPGGGMSLRVSVDDFEDIDQLAEADDNDLVTDPEIFSGAINEAYLKGFLGMTTGKVTMFANHYPVEDALKLFGAVKGYGAQIPD